LYKLHDAIQQYIKEENKKFMKGIVQIEEVIDMEEKFQKVKEKIKLYIKGKFKFWGYVEKSTMINLVELHRLAESGRELFNESFELWQGLIPYLRFKSQIKILYN